MRVFPVQMPSGGRYWTVLDDELEVVPVADRYLRELRFGRDRAESTTKAYAGGVALFVRWCARTGRDWRTAAADMGLFMTWLKYTPTGDDRVVLGPGAVPARSEGRINRVLVAVRGFLSFAVANKEVPQWVLGQLYELADARALPLEAQGEDGGLSHRLRARHRLSEPETAVDRARDEEIVALLSACRSARDRLIVLLLARVGLRRSEVAGLRRSDLHLLPDNRSVGCEVRGAHLHVVRRDNINGAWAKSRRSHSAPTDFLVVRAIDQYVAEREQCPAAADCDFLLVNLFREPLGGPVTPDAINELFGALSVRAGLARAVSPHMCRHAFGSNLADSGAALDEIQHLMRHASPSSSQPYLHPDPSRLRAAVDRVPTPRALVEGISR
ncbi:tyrosine-type recombinase/integrase [Saccharopolyspora spinosa]|uniref:Site-specific recombinase XerD n=1 Tax=Saccharopolyspora spinosa TaxID=60894 RepID=A0A2N3Y3W6_SACSN|nr:site-specific integrase [Saccharopolyspora spinosa]PKW17626.1 site-specific recombinase XerD [Saccharopolyspora spinosa]